MSRRVGRPARDTLALVEVVAMMLAENPSMSANAICRLTGGRREDVLRVVRALRTTSTRFPNPRSGIDEAAA
jgi:hypothetical protein